MEKVRWMTVPDGDGSGAGDDVLELGGRRRRVPRWWPPSAAPVLGIAALAAGLAVGYAAGARHAGDNAAPPSPSRAAAPAEPFSAGGFPLSQSGPQCSVQTDRELQVGLQITNLSPAAIRLRRVEVVLPLNGLKVVSQAWDPAGSCRPAVNRPAAFPRPPSDGEPAPGSRSPSRCWSGARSRCRSSSHSTTTSRADRPRSGCRASLTWARFRTPDAGKARRHAICDQAACGQLQRYSGASVNGPHTRVPPPCHGLATHPRKTHSSRHDRALRTP